MKAFLKKKISDKKGFTLAELLVVVAIIAILIAISIPIFTSQLNKAHESTDAANIRSAYAKASADALDSDSTDGGTATSEPMTATRTTWTYVDNKIGGHDLPATTKGKEVVVKVSPDGDVTFDGK